MLLVPLVFASWSLGASASTAVSAAGEVIDARYEIDLVGRSRATFALPAGPRTIRRFAWEPDPEAPADAWRSARVRLIWDADDPEAAGVDLPLGRFVSSKDEEDRPQTGGPPDYDNQRPMPYRQSGRIVIDAKGPVRGTFRLTVGPGRSDLGDRGYLRAEIVAEDIDSEATSPAEGRDGKAGGDEPPVRYWYDRRPGPRSSGEPG